MSLAAFAVPNPVALRDPTFNGVGEPAVRHEDHIGFSSNIPGISQAYQPVIRAREAKHMELDGSKRSTFHLLEARMAKPLAIRNTMVSRKPKTNIIKMRAIKSTEKKRAADRELPEAGGKKLSARSPAGSRPNSPTPAPNPKVPSVAEIKTHVNIPPNKSLFFSGPGGYAAKAVMWAYNKKNGYRTLPSLWKDAKYPDQFIINHKIAEEFNARASQAMAEVSSGIVYVMLPSDTTGTKWKKETVWNEFEWPNLGKGVTKVIRVNPDNDKEEVIKG